MIFKRLNTLNISEEMYSISLRVMRYLRVLSVFPREELLSFSTALLPYCNQVAYFPCICVQVEPHTLDSSPQKLLHWVSAEGQLIHSYSSLYVTVSASPFPPQLLPLPLPLPPPSTATACRKQMNCLGYKLTDRFD